MSKANYTFSTMPSVSISRSKFVRSSQHKTSINLGDIVPIYWDDVLPGDTWSFDMASLIRMSTPVVPIMDNIVMDFYAFYVPKRLVFDKFKAFFGENFESAGIPSSEYTIPQLIDDESGGTDIISGSLLDYLGLPVKTGLTLASLLTNNKISALPLRSYYCIYNRWFRNQNVIAPVPVNITEDEGALLDYEGYAVSDMYCDGALMPLKASKLPDYFTKALPYAQKGAAVTIPLGTNAPIIAVDSTGAAVKGVSFSGGVSQHTGTTAVGGSLSTGTYPTNFYRFKADLSEATAATINQLRYAFQLQKLLEKDALYGSRFWELLAAHFGVTAPDASLQDPEYLGGKRIHINIDQVLATAGDGTSASTFLGQPGANSVSGLGSSNLFAKSFVEPGIIMVMAVARHEQTYDQGIDRLLMHFSRYDDYFPVFANLGAQEIKKGELYAQGSSADGQVFGYQEAWAEYRYKRSIVTGKLRPTLSNGYGPWTLATRFGSMPTLGQTFIEQDRDSIKDSLLSGNNGPDFICDFAFHPVVVRPMPTYSIPGLIDHH